jgi:hypothetical protein
MAGNVWEWCADWFDDNYYSSSPNENPFGPDAGDLRVIRGGSWYNSWRLARSAYRIGIDPGNRWYMLGFRCVEDFDLTRADEGFAKSNIFVLDTSKVPSWDVNEDGVVDIQDLVLVGKNFGESGDEIVGDVNADGTVDISDLVIIGRHFGEITKETPPLAPPSNTGGIAQLHLKPQRRGEQLYVELVGNALYDLYGFQFDVNFDYRKLEILSVTQGALLSTNNSIHWREPKIYNRQGYIRGAAATILGSEYGITENGTLATLIFRIKEPVLKFDSFLALKNLKLIDSRGRSIPFSIKDIPLSHESFVIPNRFELGQNYPNPFNPETWLPYRLAQPADVTIQIYDMKGRLIRNLKLGSKDAGLYLSRERAAYWDGTDETGQRVSSGVYFYTIRAGDFTSTRRMILIK